MSLEVSALCYLRARLIEGIGSTRHVLRTSALHRTSRCFATGCCFVLPESLVPVLVATLSTVCFLRQPPSSAFPARKRPRESDTATLPVLPLRMTRWATVFRRYV